MGSGGDGGGSNEDAAPDHLGNDPLLDGSPGVDAGPPDGPRESMGDDAGAADTGKDSTATDAPPGAGCAGSTLALCEDFETGMLDAKTWKAIQTGGTATLDATRAARGSKYSLHVHVNPGSDTTVGILESKTFPALKGALFARAFIYIPGAMVASLFMGDRHSRLMYAQGANPYGEYAIGIWNGGLIQNHYSPNDDSQDTKMLPPFDEWFCLEYELDSTAGNVKGYLNDVEIKGLEHMGWPPTNVATLQFGVDRYGSFPVAEDIWFDDVAVDSSRIGCAR
jgi:hypothetical protein